MAYSKPQLVCQDMAVSYQAVNIAQTDIDTAWLQFGLRHGTLEDLIGPNGIVFSTPPGGLRHGVHNDVRIPRATVAVTAASLSSGVVSSPSLQGNEPQIYSRPRRVDVGVIELEVSLSEYYAEAWPKASGGVGGPVRLVVPISIFANQGALPVLRFELYEEQGGAMTPADFDFWAHIYGSP